MALAAGPSAARPIYGFEGDFLFVSYDGCRTWARRAIPFRQVQGAQSALAADWLQPAMVYLYGQMPAGGGDNQTQYGLYWSINAGRTWYGPMLAGAPAPEVNPIRHGFLAVTPDPRRYGTGGLFMATARGLYYWFGTPVAGMAVDTLLELAPNDRGFISALAVGPGVKNPIALAIQNGISDSLQVSLDAGRTWLTRKPVTDDFFIDDLLYVDDLLFVKMVSWGGSNAPAGAILMSRDDGATFIDVTGADMVLPLTFQYPTDWPREGLAASSTDLYVLSQGMGARSIPLSWLRAQIVSNGGAR
jgi:hypothetical protein